MQITGQVHTIMDAVQVSPTFRKREFVIEYADNSMYPQYILLHVFQDRCSLLDGLSVGDHVSVDFNLRGRPWNSPNGETKYFNTLEAWRINPVESEHEYGQQQAARTQSSTGSLADQAAAMYGENMAKKPVTTADVEPDAEDDLPF